MRLLERYISKISVNMMRRKPEGGGFPLEILPPIFFFNVNCERGINLSTETPPFPPLPHKLFLINRS